MIFHKVLNGLFWILFPSLRIGILVWFIQDFMPRMCKIQVCWVSKIMTQPLVFFKFAISDIIRWKVWFSANDLFDSLCCFNPDLKKMNLFLFFSFLTLLYESDNMHERGFRGTWQGVGRGFGELYPSEPPTNPLGRLSEPPINYVQIFVWNGLVFCRSLI